jgi:hypothetical protein
VVETRAKRLLAKEPLTIQNAARALMLLSPSLFSTFLLLALGSSITLHSTTITVIIV